MSEEKEKSLTKRFRECIVASPGCTLVEADFAGIEAVQTGWFAGDPDYIRLATIGVHGYLASHLLERPADLTWPNEKLAGYLAEIKHSEDKEVKATYARAKRVVHGSNYLMTPTGMKMNYPEQFKTTEVAKQVQDLYFAICPKLHAWHKYIIQTAHKQGYLGGKDHPFRYRHWFWNVVNYNRIDKKTLFRFQKEGRQVIHNAGGYWEVVLGADAKKAVAFYPQSTAAGILKEAILNLFDPEVPDTYIGDLYYGKTPFRMPIHDSIVLEVPDNKVDIALENVVRVMTAPVKQQPCPESWGIGQTDGLRIGVEVEIGKSLGEMEGIDISEMLNQLG